MTANDVPHDSSTNAWSTLRDAMYIHELPAYGNKIFYGLGFLAFTSLSILAITGIILAFMGQTWWLGSPWGIYVRSIHLWSVQAFIAVLLLHAFVGFSTSAFKKPRRMIWVFGALILCLAMFQTEFGYGLRGGFLSSQFRAVSGADFWNGAYSGYLINPLSKAQVAAIHIAIIPFAIMILFLMHFILVRMYGIAKPYRADVQAPIVPADHRIMYIRGALLAFAILIMAFFFHSPYVPPLTIASVAQSDSSLVSDTLQQEYDRTSDTATYLDSIDPYTFDTQLLVTTPYAMLIGGSATSSADMIAALAPFIANGSYQSVLLAADPAPDTYSLRLLNDMDVLEEKAGTLNFATKQWGMARDENGGVTLPPGSWWMAPLGLLNSAFDLPDNEHGDRIAAEVLGLAMLLIVAFPYIPYLNRLPELLGLAPIIWRTNEEYPSEK